MPKSTNKLKIIKTLLESPKTTGQTAIALDYVDENGHGKYKNILSDLKTLEQYRFIHRIKLEKKSVGAPATTYDIRYELTSLKKMVEKYPSLTPHLQKSNTIINLVRDSMISKLDSYKDDTDFKEYEDTYGHSRQKITKYLKISLTFFEIFLSAEIETIINRWNDIEPLLNFNVERAYYVLDFIAIQSLYQDILKGQSNPEGITYLKKSGFACGVLTEA